MSETVKTHDSQVDSKEIDLIPVDNSDNVSVSSKASESGTRSGIPKPSGIKPPSTSRIGRPCMGHQKPAIPNTPPKNGSDDTPRRFSDEYGRHKLTDVKEENEDDMVFTSSSSPTRRNRYSSIGSAASSSMDHLWDLHPRRLSEAGLSRHSDNSTILTEDTDSFIIGQRVWVAGTKPGHIAYIGETQFAPGDWAGIALDQPIGKNDGSVAGTRYFQCEPKKGIFSRLTRLTRYPLDGEAGGAGDFITSSPVNGRTSVSPTGSASPFKSPPSLTTSNTSLSSALIDFKVGDRVIIKSSQGSKIGTLRFLGCTDFAAGEWCGVELDDPRGKNDGSVGGKRYFDCRPNFGLFAPVTKVSRSPSSRKPGSCVVHSGSGIPPSGFRRANSKESLTSNVSITSAASGVRRVRLGVTSLTTPQKSSAKPAPTPLPTRTALQEVLKEKQQHIEQLLKERDLERAEVARAASHADEAEQEYATLKQEYELYRDQCERKLQEHMKLLDGLKKDRSELVANLDDEKRKNEDLQFRFEEAAITKADLEISNETSLAQIKDLEDQLLTEIKQKTEILEANAGKFFEAGQVLIRVREENDALKYEIEVAAKKIQSLESEGSSSKDVESTLHKELSELKEIIKQRDELVGKYKNDFTQISEQFEATTKKFTKELEEYKIKLEESNSEISSKQSKINQLKEEIIRVENVMCEKTKSLEVTGTTAKEFEEKANKEISKLKMEISSKTHDIEEKQELIAKKDDDIKKLTSQLENLKNNVENQNVDFDQYKENIKQVEASLRKELEESRGAIKAKINEIEETKKDFALIISQKETEIKEAKKCSTAYLEDIEKLNSLIAQIKECNTRHNEESQKVFKYKLQEAEEKISKLTNDFQSKDVEFIKSCTETAKLENDLCMRNEEVKKLHLSLESLNKHLDKEKFSSSKSKEEITKLQLEIGDLNRKLQNFEEKISELTRQKTKLENEIQELMGSSGDFSAKLEELTKELREKEKVIETTKNAFLSKLQDSERSKQEIELQYKDHVQKCEKYVQDHEEILSSLKLEKDALQQELDRSTLENKTTVENLNTKIIDIQKTLQEEGELLKKARENAIQTEEKLKEELGQTSTTLNLSVIDLQQKLSDANLEHEELKKDFSKKSIELIEFESKYNKEVGLTTQTHHELKNMYEEKIKTLEFELGETQKENQKILEASKSQLSEKLRDFEAMNTEYEKQKLKLIEQSNKLKIECEAKIKSSKEESKTIRQDLENKLVENNKSIEELNVRIKHLEETVQSKSALITKVQEEAKEGEIKLQEKLGRTTSELEVTLKESQEKIKLLTEENHKRKEELVKKNEESLDNEARFQITIEELQQKESVAKSDYDRQLKNLTEDLNTKNNELQKTVEEIAQLKQLATSGEVSSSERDNQISQLKSELHINHKFIEELQREKKELQNLKEGVDKTLTEKENYCTNLTMEIMKLNEEIKRSSQSSYEMDTANNLYITILQMLQLSEKQKIDLVDALEIAAKGECDEESYSKLCKLVDGIRINSEPSEETQKLKKAEDELERYKKQQHDSDTKIKIQETEIIELKNNLQKAAQIKSRIPKMDNPSMSSNVSNNPSSNNQLLEDKQLAESQVAFLNSIIVDMQKKNTEQKARIEILEMGYSPAAAEELGLLGLANKKLPAPRMYCDICEEFDLHETEDCPQQSNDDPPPRDNTLKKEKAPQRPYCEICEEFGHATEDCQDDETY